jgi:hypothetical protein
MTDHQETTMAQPATHQRPTDAAGTTAPAAQLIVLPWPDSVHGLPGHDPRSLYVEKFWLGILGPSTTLLLRRVARGFDDRPDGFAVSVVDTARALGLGEGTGKNSMVMRTVERACQFGMARPGVGGELLVRTELPWLNARQVSRLPEILQRAHARELDRYHGDVGGAA